jgi:membrane protein YdbS with pleckstrin-like domain
MRRENEWFKPEKLTAYAYAVEAIVLALVLAFVGFLYAVGALFELPESVLLAGAAVLVAVFAYLTWWIGAFYRTAAYRLTADELEYRRGVFFQQKSTVPYNRITNVDASQGPLQRLVGAGSVGIHTAGFGGQMGAELTVTGVADFEEIKEQVLDRVRRRAPAATEGEDATAEMVPDSTGAVESNDVLAELRRIRELLERGRNA